MLIHTSNCSMFQSLCGKLLLQPLPAKRLTSETCQRRPTMTPESSPALEQDAKRNESHVRPDWVRMSQFQRAMGTKASSRPNPNLNGLRSTKVLKL